MTSPPGFCVRGEAGCPDAQKPDVLSNSLNAAGETFMRQFTNSFAPEDLDSVNSNILSVILVISSLVLSYVLLKFTTYYITIGFLSVMTLLHYWFGSKWCLDVILAGLSNLYTFLIMSAQYPKVSAVAVLGMIGLSIWLSLRSYWKRTQKEKKEESEKQKEGERIKRIEDKVNQVLNLLQDQSKNRT